MYYVETYTQESGSNMDELAYNTNDLFYIFQDLCEFKNWDYALVTDEDECGIAIIHNNGVVEMLGVIK